jgi:uncharacterized tellurite resistance protein B-like protein
MSARGKLAWYIALATIDGSIDDKELKLITEFGLRNGLDRNDVAAVAKNFKQYLGQVPTSVGEKRTFIKELWQLLAADGKVEDAEATLVAKLAVALGFTKNEVLEIIKAA